MFNIAVIGDDAKQTLFHNISSACSAYGVVRLSKRGLHRADFRIIKESRIKTGEDYDIVVLGDCLCTELSGDTAASSQSNSLIGMSAWRENFCGTKLPKTKICILDSGSKNAVKLVHKNGLTALTCSMAVYDTLTADSIADRENILISLQRDITRLDGTVLEAQDFRLNLNHDMPIYSMLASCGVLLLCGIGDTTDGSVLKFP